MGISHIPNMPQVVPGGKGYLKMSFTQKLKDILMYWYRKRRLDAMEIHDVIPGGYTNSDKVKMGRIYLEKYPSVMRALVKEMRQVLQWWTGRALKHTATFGVRVYKRGSMLTDHVDRQDTHLASAVLQIDQEADPDGGWPLE